MKSTDLSEESYRPSGDEFIMQGKTKEEIDDAIKKAYDYLKQNPIRVKKDDKITIIPARFSYGTAETLEKAEEKLRVHKAEREARGERARRGKKPPGILGPIPERLFQFSNMGQLFYIISLVTAFYLGFSEARYLPLLFLVPVGFIMGNVTNG